MRNLIYFALLFFLIVFFLWLAFVQNTKPRFNQYTGQVLNQTFYNTPDMSSSVLNLNPDDCDVGNCITGSLISKDVKCDVYCAQDTDEASRNECYKWCNNVIT